MLPVRSPHTSKGFRHSAARFVLCGSQQRSHRLRARAELSQSAKPKSRVVCIGEALFDLIADQKGVPRDKVKSWKPYAGGAPCNVATSLGKLGLDVVFITALGQDERGDQLLALLKASHVKTHGVQLLPKPTRDVYVTRDDKGDREFAGFGLSSEVYSDCFIDAARLPLDDIKSAAVLVTGTLGLAYPHTRDAMHTAVNAAKKAGCKVLVDVNWRPVFWEDKDEARRLITEYLKQADVIKLSDADLKWLHHMELTPALTNPCAVAEHYPHAVGVLVTAGEEGASYCFNSGTKGQHSGYVPCFQVDVVDTTGAGDAFTAGFLYRLIKAGGLEALSCDPAALKEAVVFASAAGALTTTKPGAIEGQPGETQVLHLYESSRTWNNFW